MRESWTDEPLDPLVSEIRDLRREMNDRFDGVDKRLDHMGDRVSAMHQMMLQGVIGLCGVLLTGFVVLGSLIIAQL